MWFLTQVWLQDKYVRIGHAQFFWKVQLVDCMREIERSLAGQGVKLPEKKRKTADVQEERRQIRAQLLPSMPLGLFGMPPPLPPAPSAGRARGAAIASTALPRLTTFKLSTGKEDKAARLAAAWTDHLITEAQFMAFHPGKPLEFQW
jgi:hypothetical protein